MVVIVVGQARDVYESIDEQFANLHEYTEVRHTGDNAVELVAEVLLHVLALEPRLDVAGGVLGAFFMG